MHDYKKIMYYHDSSRYNIVFSVQEDLESLVYVNYVNKTKYLTMGHLI